MISDRASEDMSKRADHVEQCDDSELSDLLDLAAREFTAYTLWRSIPTEWQGDQSRAAWAIREQRADRARGLWLAVKAEQERRWARAESRAAVAP